MLVVINVCALLLSISLASAQNLDSSVQVEQQINENSASSQTRVSGLARQTQDLLTQYRSIVRETESLKIYNDNLERVVSDQQNEV
jgi:regulator of replication initiation timing